MADVEARRPIGNDAGRYIHGNLIKTGRKALVFASGDTVKSFTINANALTHSIIFEMPTFSGAAVTGTFSIENSDGKELYSNGGVAEGAVDMKFPEDSIERPLVGDNTVKVTLSTDPLSDGTVYVTMYLQGS